MKNTILNKMSKELKKLATETKKYKNAEEFVQDYQAAINWYRWALQKVKNNRYNEYFGNYLPILTATFKGDVSPYQFRLLEKNGIEPKDFYRWAKKQK